MNVLPFGKVPTSTCYQGIDVEPCYPFLNFQGAAIIYTTLVVVACGCIFMLGLRFKDPLASLGSKCQFICGYGILSADVYI